MNKSKSNLKNGQNAYKNMHSKYSSLFKFQDQMIKILVTEG
jgi:hypothetical protein